MKKKTCSKCDEEKDICEFYKNSKSKDGLYSLCKVCQKKRVIYYQRCNSEKIKKWKKINIAKFKEKNPYYTKNYYKKRKESDPLFKLSINMRVRLIQFLKIKNIGKKNKTFEIIGCSPLELKVYLENRFTIGMNWENHGKWHIDHIIPLSSGKTEEEIYKLSHYTNLQPLWSEDNIKKGSK
jgi:hypothetical protein